MGEHEDLSLTEDPVAAEPPKTPAEDPAADQDRAQEIEDQEVQGWPDEPTTS